jgi:hypothetical protein
MKRWQDEGSTDGIEQEPEWDSACLHALEKSSMPYSAGNQTMIPQTCNP